NAKVYGVWVYLSLVRVPQVVHYHPLRNVQAAIIARTKKMFYLKVTEVDFVLGVPSGVLPGDLRLLYLVVTAHNPRICRFIIPIITVHQLLQKDSLMVASGRTHKVHY
ncbi:hypothetical protein HN873_027923, partial [Arachis hypogaea]